MRRSLRRITALTGRNVKEIRRDPLSLIFMILLPLGMELLFYYLFGGMTAQFQMRYLAPGIAAFAQAFLTLFCGLLIATDRSTSLLVRLYVSGARPYEFILSYALAVLPVCLIQTVLFFGVGGAIDPSLFGTGMLIAVLLSLYTSLFFISLGILIGSLCSEKSVGGVSSVIISGQSLLSGVWFPAEGLNEGFVCVMDLLPFKSAAALLQSQFIGIGDLFADFVRPLLTLTAYTALAFVLAILTFRKKMHSC